MALSMPRMCNSWSTARCFDNAVAQSIFAQIAGQHRHKAPARRLLLVVACSALAALSHAKDAADLVAVVAGDAQATEIRLVDANSPEAPARSLGSCIPAAHPAWSHDGRLLAYEVSRADGAGSQIAWRLWGDRAPEGEGVCGSRFRYHRNPAVSPDGRYIACEAYDELPYESAIVVIDRESGEEAIWGGARRALFTPEWLPNPKLLLSLDPNRKVEIPGVDLNAIRAESGLADGSAITGGPTRALFCVGLDNREGLLTTEVLLLTESQSLPVLALVPDGPDSTRYSEWNPRISPGGTRFVFESDYGGDREIYQLDQNGLLNLTNHHAADWNPAWSENGRWVAFETFRNGMRQVQRILVETVRVEPLLEEESWSPSWAPNGEELAAVVLRDGRPRVALVNAGTRELRLTEPEPAWSPSWRP